MQQLFLIVFILCQAANMRKIWKERLHCRVTHAYTLLRNSSLQYCLDCLSLLPLLSLSHTSSSFWLSQAEGQTGGTSTARIYFSWSVPAQKASLSILFILRLQDLDVYLHPGRCSPFEMKNISTVIAQHIWSESGFHSLCVAQRPVFLSSHGQRAVNAAQYLRARWQGRLCGG